MAQFSKFKFLIAFDKILMGVNFIKKHQNLAISKCRKSHTKVEVAEEIGCWNELKRLWKIDGKNEMSFN